MNEPSQAEQVGAVAALQDPIRRALFTFISRSPSPVGRDGAATAVRVPRTTAAFHLDRLVEAGVLTVEFSKLNGRTGPGSGRPAKLYRLASTEVSAAVPERHYDLMGDVLAASIEAADESGGAIRESLTTTARRRGRELGATAGNLDAMLERTGYVPEAAEDGSLNLTNCPFHRLAASHTDIICQANLALLEGAADGANEHSCEIIFEPGEGHCCVRIGRTDALDSARLNDRAAAPTRDG
jgi:predicted ArsR family transcriptional regulator